MGMCSAMAPVVAATNGGTSNVITKTAIFFGILFILGVISVIASIIVLIIGWIRKLPYTILISFILSAAGLIIAVISFQIMLATGSLALIMHLKDLFIK